MTSVNDTVTFSLPINYSLQMMQNIIGIYCLLTSHKYTIKWLHNYQEIPITVVNCLNSNWQISPRQDENSKYFLLNPHYHLNKNKKLNCPNTFLFPFKIHYINHNQWDIRIQVTVFYYKTLLTFKLTMNLVMHDKYYCIGITVYQYGYQLRQTIKTLIQ